VLVRLTWLAARGVGAAVCVVAGAHSAVVIAGGSSSLGPYSCLGRLGMVPRLIMLLTGTCGGEASLAALIFLTSIVWTFVTIQMASHRSFMILSIPGGDINLDNVRINFFTEGINFCNFNV
jgi:hypothetical protein